MIRRRNFRQIVAVLLLATLFVFSSAYAHDVRPAYLEIKETVPGQFSLLWRTPVLAGMRLPVALKLPDARSKGLSRKTAARYAVTAVTRRAALRPD